MNFDVSLKFLMNSIPSSAKSYSDLVNCTFLLLVYTPTIKFERQFIAKSCTLGMLIDLTTLIMNSEHTGAISTNFYWLTISKVL